MIYDAHHHFWHYNDREFGWIDGTMSPLRRDYLPVDLEREIQGTRNASVSQSKCDDTTERGKVYNDTAAPLVKVSGSVVVQARQSLDETRWLLGIAEQYDYVKGVVGWINLISEHLEEELDEFTGNPRLVGVRHVLHDEPDDDFMLRHDFLRGIEKLGEHGLAYDLLLRPRHLKRAVRLAGMFPEQKFVLDHLGKPFIKAGELDPWRGDLESLADCPNVWCKISGMVTEGDRKNWKYEDFIPYLAVVMKTFGSDRLMLGSDWPVCLLAGSYGEVMGIPLQYLQVLDPAGRVKIMRTNCVDFYGLSP